jgi:hypothetical protein
VSIVAMNEDHDAEFPLQNRDTSTHLKFPVLCCVSIEQDLRSFSDLLQGWQ